MDLDHSISSAVMKAHSMERALHSPHRWFIATGGVKRLAERIVSADRIAFFADFPSGLPFVAMPEGVTLLEGNTIRGVREFHYPGGPFAVSWEFALTGSGEPVQA